LLEVQEKKKQNIIIQNQAEIQPFKISTDHHYKISQAGSSADRPGFLDGSDHCLK
jgi:hypothetical protein